MSTCPISSLDNDTLLTVFDLITSRMPQWLDTETDRPLTVVRVASQVCQRWRELLLVSRWIWGRVIDLDVHGGPRKIEWLEKVSRRAGSAPMWIHGRVKNPTVGSPWLSTQAFFIQLLQSWERIERFSVIIDSDDKKIINNIQSYFMCRSPILKSFDVYFDSIFFDALRPGSSRSLFAGYAPSLRTIKSNQIAYKPDSPWLSNIREISSFPKNLHLNDIFVLLQHTPLIERIGLYEDVSWTGQAQSPSPKYMLPNLSSITVFSGLATLVRLLDHISPARLSSLFLNICDRGLTDLTLLTSLTEGLLSYVANYFTSNVSTTLFLWITDTALRICDVSNALVGPDGQKHEFEVLFRTIQARNDWDHVVVSLLDAFALPVAFTPPFLFRTITQIQLPLLIVQPTIIPHLYSMLSGFQQVTSILTNEQCGDTLYALSCLDKDGGDPRNVLFPALDTLRLMTISASNNNEEKDLTLFIKRRKLIGFAVTKLDLTSCNRSNYAQDLRDLEEVNGLEVIWKGKGDGSGEGHRICSYVCGTGKPEQLKGIL